MGKDDDILDYAQYMHCQSIHLALDEDTGLRGIIVIHNTKLGPSLGGCRLLEYPTTYQACFDAVRLAQGMSYKASLAGLELGGGKSVIIKPKHIKDRKTLFEAFGSFIDKLNGEYITAVDLGTSIEDMDVIATKTKHVTSTSHCDFSTPDPSSLTALGVIRAMEAAVKYKYKKDGLDGIHVAIQGVGHVGYSLAKLLFDMGAKITAFDPSSENIQRVKDEFGANSVATFDELISLESDIFAPCAIGGILNDETIPKLNCKMIVGAANNQLGTPEHSKVLTKKGIVYAPDFVVNAGGLIYVGGQYFKHTEDETKQKILDIYGTMLKIFNRSEKDKLCPYEVSYKMAVERIKHGEFAS